MRSSGATARTKQRKEVSPIPTLTEEVVQPVSIGPTWQRNPDWNGEPYDGINPETSEYLLPEFTLGWQILKWISENCLADEVDETGKPMPFNATDEQKRFILWWYAIDARGRFVYREGVLQRLKGWGRQAKTP